MCVYVCVCVGGGVTEGERMSGERKEVNDKFQT